MYGVKPVLPGPWDCGSELAFCRDMHLPLFCMLSCAGRCLATGRFRSERKQQGLKKYTERRGAGWNRCVGDMDKGLFKG